MFIPGTLNPVRNTTGDEINLKNEHIQVSEKYDDLQLPNSKFTYDHKYNWHQENSLDWWTELIPKFKEAEIN